MSSTSSSPVSAFFDNLWQDYVKLTPSAERVHRLLGDSKPVVNDHVAFRTFNISPVSLSALTPLLESLGYCLSGEYQFETKQLDALHFEHTNPLLPKIFISELRVEAFSKRLQGIVERMVSEIPSDVLTNPSFFYSGRHWHLNYREYQQLLQESEYAAWLAAFGFRANHFTVSVNHLDAYEDIREVNQLLKNHEFRLNESGGEIKGSKAVLLEQSSTLADAIEIEFSDQKASIPSCFYEFAQRYRQSDGSIYKGFVAASADKIFESTNTRQG